MKKATANFVSTKEAAFLLGVTPGRVRQFAHDGRLTATKVGPVMLFSMSELKKFQAIPRKSGRPRKEK